MSNDSITRANCGFIGKTKKRIKENKNFPFIIVNPVFRDEIHQGEINRSQSIDSISNINFTINDKIVIGIQTD